MKLIHTSDWQIGKTFGFADDETRQVLRDERIEVVGRIGRLAVQHGASTVLVAGDVFDVEALAERTLRQPIERMRQFPGVTWHLIPGNHDPHTPSGPWDRLARCQMPDNVVLHLTLAPALLAGGMAFVLPAVLTRRHAASDPTAAMDGMVTPDGAIRIGLAHGSVTSFGSDSGTTHNLLARDRPERAGLAYLALGDWHGAQLHGSCMAYSGTPEPDGFDLGGRGGGEVLLVEIAGSGAAPEITFLPTGRFRWYREGAVLEDAAGIAALNRKLRAVDPDPSRMLVQLEVSGTLSVADRNLFESTIRVDLGSAVRALRIIDADLLLSPSAADLAALSRAGSVGVAAERLQRRADDPADPQRDLARAALQRLYLLHAREHRTA